MQMIMTKIQRFGRLRQLHTIISQQTVKPSSPTPPHLKTHNLSLVDRLAPNIHMPWVLFFQNFNKGDINILKKSLSQCLTRYYTFAGRFFPSHIDCNDQGIEFLEASHDSRLDDFVFKKEQDKNINQLIPNGLGYLVGKSSPNMVEVQLNHFKGGGSAMGVSISHKVADAVTMANFLNHWATITRGGSPINPNLFSPSTNNNININELVLNMNNVKYVTRKFVFPNSKLNELKLKVSAMGVTPKNLTRVEVLTSLIFKCKVDAATTKSGFFKPSNMLHAVNMRNKIIRIDPEKAAGNIFTPVIVKTSDPSEISLNELVFKLRKGKKELEGLTNIQEVGESFINILSMLEGDPSQQMYATSSVCELPFYEVDFGWGKPVEVTLAGPNTNNKALYLMDTPHKDGIVAKVHLPHEEMAIFEEDKELLKYVNNDLCV